MPLTADDFNRANNTSSMGQTDGGGTLDPLTWTNSQGTNGILSNQAYCSALSSFRGIGTVDCGQSDVDITAQIINPAAGAIGFVFRYQDINNYWMAVGNFGTTTALIKNVAGSTTTPYSTGGGATNDILRVVAIGSTIQFYRNSILLQTITDNFMATKTRVGFYTEAITNSIDNWSVSYAFVPPPVFGVSVPATTLNIQTVGSLIEPNGTAYINDSITISSPVNAVTSQLLVSGDNIVTVPAGGCSFCLLQPPGTGPSWSIGGPTNPGPLMSITNPSLLSLGSVSTFHLNNSGPGSFTMTMVWL
jgi:hypothetical protein